jgi:hypothetical protein
MHSRYFSTALFLIQVFVGTGVGVTALIRSSQASQSLLVADGQSHEHDGHMEDTNLHESHETIHDEAGLSDMGEHTEEASGHGSGHHHGSIDVSGAVNIPSIQLVVHEDPVSGWNLELMTENFTFAPERVNSESTINEGHAHLYINGEKVMRIYSHWHHLPELEPGINTVRITLNTNGHDELVNQGEVVASSVVITVP